MFRFVDVGSLLVLKGTSYPRDKNLNALEIVLINQMI